MSYQIFNKIEEYLMAGCLMAMAVINFGNVLSRYFLNASWSYTQELLLILFVWCVMLGSAVAFKRSDHLGLPIIFDKLPDSIKIVNIVFVTIVSSFFSIALCVSAYYMVRGYIIYNQTTPVLNLPEWVSGGAVLIGAFLIVVRSWENAIRNIYILIKGGLKL